MTRTEGDVTRAFVSLASSLAAGDDVVDMLAELTQDCVRLLGVGSAGLLLTDEHGVLHVMAASSERTRELEVFQVQRDDGPCRDCHQTGRAVSAPDLTRETARWPQFAPHALEAGFASVHAVPMRLRTNNLGALGLFGTTVGSLEPDDLDLAQGLADVASVALVQDRASNDSSAINAQLQTALSTRVVLEQAKGLLAQQGDLDMEAAFAVLRRYGRDRNLRLSEVARAVVSRELPAQLLLEHDRARTPSPRTAQPPRR